jgi:hypothetical protein
MHARMHGSGHACFVSRGGIDVCLFVCLFVCFRCLFATKPIQSQAKPSEAKQSKAKQSKAKRSKHIMTRRTFVPNYFRFLARDDFHWRFAQEKDRNNGIRIKEGKQLQAAQSSTKQHKAAQSSTKQL